MKKLIINCDDFGISKETNLGIIDCLSQKKATSASIIANSEFFDHALKNIEEKVQNNWFGIHLNLTEGTALNSDSIKNLTNKDFKFNKKASEFFLMNLNRKKEIIDNLIYLEFKAQILKVKKAGIRISHFDSHEHIHHSPWLFKIITILAKEFKINKIRFVNEKIILKNYFKDMLYKFISLNYLKHLIINICNTRVKNGLLSPDYFFGILNSGKVKKDELFLYLEKINQNKTIEFCTHPANKTVNKIKTEEESYNNFYLDKNRFYEKDFLLSDEFSNFIKQKNIKLINFSDLN